MPQNKDHEINRRNHKGVNTIEKVQTLISMIDTPMGQEKISQGYNPLGSILKRRLPTSSLPPQTRINTNIQTILNIPI